MSTSASRATSVAGYTDEGILAGIPPATTTAAATPRPQTGPLGRADRRLAILAGAAAAFADRGFAATSMEEIAAASGITKLIVYRHFDSKEDLYRAVLERVHERLTEEFRTGVTEGPEGIARSMLTVAREYPDGVRLLWRHSAREPAFVQYCDELRTRALTVSRTLLEPYVDPSMREWAAQTSVGYWVEAVLAWLDAGDPTRDEQFVAYASGALRAAVSAWASSTP
jgi:AcrR family transcriptional regulator